MLFLLPLCFATIFGGPASIASSSADPEGEPPIIVEAYLVNLDTGTYGREVARALSEVSILDLEEINDSTIADKSVAEGEFPAAIIITKNFSDNIDDGVPTQVHVITDPGQDDVGGIVAGIVNHAVTEVGILGELKLGIRTVLEQLEGWEEASPEAQNAAKAQSLGVIWTQVQQMRSDPVIGVQAATSEGAEVDSGWNPFTYYAPSFGVMFAFFLVGFMAESFLRDKETGVFQRVLASPIHASTLVAGKSFPTPGLCFYKSFCFLVSVLFFSKCPWDLHRQALSLPPSLWQWRQPPWA